MRMERYKYFFKLIMRVDLTTYVFGVPLAVYIVMFCGNFQGDALMALGFGVIVSACIVTPIRIILSARRLLPIFGIYFDKEANEADLTRAKNALVHEPRKQGYSLMYTWFFAIITACTIAHIISPFDAIKFATVPIILSLTMPSGFIYTYFITEKHASLLLKDRRLSSIPIVDIHPFTILKKIFLSLFVIMWYPTVTFAFIIYEISNSIIVIENIGFHIAAIFVMMIANMLYIAFTLTSSLKATLKETNQGVEDLSRGNLDTSIPLLTSDEIGGISVMLNMLIGVLKEAIMKIYSEAQSLNGDSELLSREIIKFTDESRETASSVEEMTAALEELGASSESIARNSREQNLKTEKIYAVFSNLNNGAAMISEKATVAAGISESAVERAAFGEKILRDTLLKIQGIKTSTVSINDAVSIIKDIADKVNLLSLNASIEAARAGEYGRGFSVVAEEISKLADSTQTNAGEISRRIDETLHTVVEGIDYMDRTVDSFKNIIDSVKETSVIMRTIAEDSVVQAKASSEIGNNFSSVISMASENLQATSEQAATHQEFIRSVARISEMVQKIAGIASYIGDYSLRLVDRALTLNRILSFFRIR